MKWDFRQRLEATENDFSKKGIDSRMCKTFAIILKTFTARKTILSAFFLFFPTIYIFALEIFSIDKMYVKAEVGYSFIAPEIDDVYLESDCIQLTPTFAIFPFYLNDMFSVEASCAFFSGKSENVTVNVFSPKIMALVYIPADDILDFNIFDKISAFFGAGFSVPIQMVEIYGKKETVARVKFDMQMGGVYELSDKIAICASLTSGLLRPWQWGVQAGAMYFLR